MFLLKSMTKLEDLTVLTYTAFVLIIKSKKGTKGDERRKRIKGNKKKELELEGELKKRADQKLKEHRG